MKKRVSIGKAEHSRKRADSYQQMCEQILFNKGSELQIIEQEVYIIESGGKKLLLEVTNSKTMWFEIWVKLADR